MSTGARLLVVGLDGATWTLARRFMSEGRMPVLSALVEEGTCSSVRSTWPPMTLPAWSSMLTGAGPGRHGVFDFTWRVPGEWRVRFTNATHRRLPTLHRVLSNRGARVASLLVPATFPPEELDGVTIAGFDSPVATVVEGAHCRPRSLHRQISRRFGRLCFADFQETVLGPGWHDAARRALLAAIERKEEVARWLLGRERWDLFMLVFGESDTAAHHFWRFFDTASPRFQPGAHRSHRDTIPDVYARLDAALGRLIDAARPDLLCVVSDHGFGGAGAHAVYLNRLLEQAGWLKMRDPGRVAEGVSWGTSRVDVARDLFLRHLPPRLQAGLVRSLPAPLLGDVESRSRFGHLDLGATRALSEEMNYAATLHLSLAGRDPGGTIRDVDGAVSELEHLLLGWEADGLRVVKAVHRREALYSGDMVDRAPDLLLELHRPGGYTHTLLPSVRVPPGTTWRRLEPGELDGGKGLGMNGTHREHGLLLLHGPAVARGVEVEADLQDVAPTLLHLLGEPLSPTMEGRVLHRAARELRPVMVEDAPWAPGEPVDLGAGDAALVRRRLEDLGYL